MIKRERLYDAFGELIYAIALADGAVQKEEIEALNHVLRTHPWAKQIQWSFDYEIENKHSVEDAYQKALDICKENGPDPEYKYLLQVMTAVAKAFGGIVPQEAELIDNFRYELRDRFIKDLEDHDLVYISDVD
jgi:uncharacterized tellurite resistance protein B-like protein